MRRSGPTRGLIAAVVAATLLTACGGNGDAEGEDAGADGGSASGFPEETIQFMIPAAAGGGWDTTGRLVAKTLEDAEISPVPIQPFNVEGGSGTVGLAQLVRELEGDPYTIAVTGLTMQGSIHTNDSAVTLADVTPLARLLTEYSVLMVSPESPYKSFEDVVEAWQAEGAGLTFAGGGAGGPDHQVIGSLATELDIPSSEVNYVVYEGGGEALPQVLNGQIDVVSAGLAEFLPQIESGDLVPLAVSSPERVGALPDVPTFIELGVDVTMANWRGIIAPPGISDEAREWYIDALEQMTETDAWQEALETYDWNPYFLPGDEFGDVLNSESDEVKQRLVDIGVIQ